MTKYLNGRAVGKGYETDDCPLYENIGDAVKELAIRTQQLPEIAPFLQTLICEIDDSGNITSYEPVRSGSVMQAMTDALQEGQNQ